MLALGTAVAHAAPPTRLAANAARTAPAELPQGVSPRVQHSTRLGRLSADTPIETMSLVLAPSAEQTAALDQLLADQQTPGSASYHQWLTPEQFGERFGASDADLKVLQNWLTSQGLLVTGVATSRNSIQFSGRADTVEAAFHMEFHRFQREGQNFFENSTPPELPAGLLGIVQSVEGLSSYRVKPDARRKVLQPDPAGVAQPNATSANGLTHFIAPWDFRQIYNTNTLFNSGYTGTGVTIGVIGQSAVDTQQLNYFQTLTGQSVKNPTLVLVPNSGSSVRSQEDEGESEADLEHASGGAPGASLIFVYTGSSSTTGVYQALQYAISNRLASILTLSYGSCETGLPGSFVQGIESSLRQANAQGQTVLISSGDAGAAGCDGGNSAPAYDGAQVSYPASSAYVTAVGGTTLVDGTGTYWSPTNNSQRGSALGYIPETVWNDSTATVLSSSGGGASRIFGKPNWQTGTGVPADGARDVPDVSFSASNQNDPYLLCSSDPADVIGTRTGACTATTFGGIAVGGTSLSSPSFAAALAILENANGGTSLGNINPLLYALRTSTPAIFHDVTTGNNQVPCASGTLGCTNGLVGYVATTGYDLATGLGSMDLGALSSAITAAGNAAAATPTLDLYTTVATTTQINVALRVSGNRSATVPTGNVTFTIDGGSPQTVALNSSQAAGNFTGTFTVGTHTVTASYAGDGTYGAATGTLAVTVQAANATVSLSATPSTLTVATAGAGRGTWSVTTTSVNGYAGLLGYDITMADGSTPKFGGCFLGQGDLGLSAGSTATTTITYSVLKADCSTSGAIPVAGGMRKLAALQPAPVKPVHGTPAAPLVAVAFTGLLGSAALRRRRKWMTGLLAVAFLAATGALHGCGSGYTPTLSSTNTTSNGGTTVAATKGTYNLLITVGPFTSTTAIATTPVTLIIQ